MLWVYLSVLDDKSQLTSEQYCKEIFTQVLAQQDEIRFNHGDVRIENIMDNPNTGKCNFCLNEDKGCYSKQYIKLFASCVNSSSNFGKGISKEDPINL